MPRLRTDHLTGVQVTGGIRYSPRTAGALARAHAVLAELLEE